MQKLTFQYLQAFLEGEVQIRYSFEHNNAKHHKQTIDLTTGQPKVGTDYTANISNLFYWLT